MSSHVNRHGLKRSDLSAAMRRQLRQEAGFGCVVCGNAVGDYEHIDPEFSEALQHDVAKMAFLCLRCHGNVTRGRLSKETVLAAKLSPKARQTGFSFEAFDVGNKTPLVRFGPMTAEECESIVIVNGRPVFWIAPPEVEGGPFRLSAEMRNARGEVIFSISDNVWNANSGNWDVDVVGPVITLRDGPGQVALRIRTVPPNEIIVERMHMVIEGCLIRCDGRQFEVILPNGTGTKASAQHFKKCRGAVNIEGGGEIHFGFWCETTAFSGSITLAPSTKPAVTTECPRNSNCSCGSGKKWKHCCGAAP